MTGQEIELPDKAAGTFNVLLPDLDEDAADAERIAERNRINRNKGLTNGDHSSPLVTNGDNIKSKTKNLKNTPYSPPRGGRRRKDAKTGYTDEDLRRIESLEVDLEGSDERVEKI
jgi:hypothetical protein